MAPQATPIRGTEEQVKKMIREAPREGSAALYITKIRGSPEAELEKTTLFTTYITVQKFPENSNTIIVIFEIKKAGGKNCRRDPIKVQANESLLWNDFIDTFDLKQQIQQIFKSSQ